MNGKSNIQLTIGITDPTLDSEEREEEIQRLFNQMQSMDEIESIDRVIDSEPPDGSKPLMGFLIGVLTAEITPDSFKLVMRFLQERLSGRGVELRLEANGKKLEVTANNKEELLAVIRMAQDFIDS